MKERDEETLKKDWLEDVKFLAKFEQHYLDFLDNLNTLRNGFDGHFGRKNIGKHRTDLLNDKVKSVHSVPYRTGPVARQSSAAEID